MRYHVILAVASTLGMALVCEVNGQAGASQAGAKPVFPTQINVVRMDLVALDASGQPVPDLTKDDIQVLENGKPQEVVSFAAISYPVTSTTYREVLTDVASNAGADEGRLVFLVLDDSNSLRSRTEFIKQAATRLVERLGPQDWVAMLWVSQSRGGAIEFTRDHGRVLRAIEEFAGVDTRVERWFGKDEIRPGLTQFNPLQMSDPFPARGEENSTMATTNLQAVFDAERPLQILKDVSNKLKAIEARRRVVVYVGQGTRRIHRNLMPDTTGTGAAPDPVLGNTLAAAKAANVTFYTIDVSAPETRDARGPSRTEGARVGELGYLSTSTGGVTSSYANPIEAADRVITDTSLYYLVGYSAEPPKPREGARRVEVRTTRPGVRLLAQQSHVPLQPQPPPGPREEAGRAVRDLIPQRALSLRVFAAPFADWKQKKQPVAVAVEVTLPESSTPDAAKFADDVEMSLVAALPGEGIRAADQLNARLSLDPEKSRAFKGRYVLCARTAVEPGQYQLRVGLKSAAARRAGSVYLDVSVPDFAAQPISLSGLVIGQARRGDLMPVAGVPAIAPLVPFPPTLARDFTTQDEAWAFARVYRGKASGDDPVVVMAIITRTDSGETAWTSAEKSTIDLGARREAEYRVALPLSSLPPGSYRLHIEATQPGGPPSAIRELDFRVTPE